MREKLREVIARDVIRLDRLISDISNLSRLEGEIVREKLERVDLGRLLGDIARSTATPDARAKRRSVLEAMAGSVMEREGPLAQVIRNLVENARSFSPPGGEVKVTLLRTGAPRAPDGGRQRPRDSPQQAGENFRTLLFGPAQGLEVRK